jgi:hypothetical protein
MNSPYARGPRYRQLPLWRDAQRMLLEVEQAVRAFPRYHKYSLGTELRRQAMDVNRLVARAAQENDPARRAALVERLVWTVEDLKMSVQLAKELEAFASFAQFQRLAEQAVALGGRTPTPKTSFHAVLPSRGGKTLGAARRVFRRAGWWKRARSVAGEASRTGASPT